MIAYIWLWEVYVRYLFKKKSHNICAFVEISFSESNGGEFFIRETVKSHHYQSARFCCDLFWVTVQSSAWWLFTNYKYLKNQVRTYYHWYHGLMTCVSKSFWTEELALIKTKDLHFYLAIKQTTYFVDCFT